MPDATLTAIDRFFDLVDNGVEQVGRVLGCDKQPSDKVRVVVHDKQPPDKARARRARGSEIVLTEARSKQQAPKPRGALPMTALVRKPRFYIVEAVVSGSTQFVVTDGGNARTMCATRAFAEQILKALEKAQ